ncbi:site-specific integrase [Paraburkholderia oxyphila]|uniref:site-specific integrase n=1 Tax=Paraburkholderia oxyphila TaxID=614212 RepID=UPI0005B885D0|nr:site-specific integrase [Paraburkholderia oxyphila]
MNHSKTINNVVSRDLAIRLPETAATKRGVSFRPQEDVWEWFDGPFRLHLDYRRFHGQTVFLREPLKHALMVFAKGSSSSHVYNLFQALTHFLSSRDEAAPLADITIAEVSSYSARLRPHEKWRLSTLNVLLQKWVALALPGVDPECAKYLRQRRKPGNTKGRAVLTRDPEEGPFSEAEYTALYKAVDTAYGKGELPLWATVLTRLLFACGGRTSQYASLKIMDFGARDGTFVLNLPQAKTREAHARSSFKEFDLSPQTGRLVQEYITVLSTSGWPEDSPLFPDSAVMTFGQKKRTADDIFFGHCTGDALTKVFAAALNPIAPPTQRLNYEPMPLAPRRFRYTFGTRLAEEGASKVVIADRLGHVDLQQVGVYVQATPKIVENIDAAMGKQLAPLAHAFKGQLVEGEEQSTQRGALGSRIIDFRVSKDPVGSCAGRGCGFSKPDACYTCFKFEPWLDAPHEKVYHRLMEQRNAHAGDERIAAINDDAIRAVQEVMAECAAVKAQRENAEQESA